jgi:hypothetical protein
VRLGNPLRRQDDELVRAETCAGELGWSSEWRKRELTRADRRDRTLRWREYCCESFCDTASWIHGGMGNHPEFTLCRKSSALRATWFRNALGNRRLSI